MTDKLNEQLSAFLDNELASEECDLLWRRLDGDQALRDTVSRFSLMGDAMRGEPLQASPAFVAGVSAALQSDSSPQIASPAWQRWLKPVSGIAVAATVASVALLSLQGTDEQDLGILPSSTVAEVSSDDSNGLSPIVPRMQLPEVRQASAMPQSQMDRYLMRHRGYATGFGGRTIMGVRDVGRQVLLVPRDAHTNPQAADALERAPEATTLPAEQR